MSNNNKIQQGSWKIQCILTNQPSMFTKDSIIPLSF